jgi:putative ABC transport system substrate-binding protein
MRRREFLIAVGGTTLAWPIAARSQQAGRLPTIGFLGATTAAAQPQWTAAFVQRLQDHGWVDGRTVTIEYRWGEGHGERYAPIAAEFVRLNVDVIVAPGGATLAAKQATSVIPIVFTAASDPVGSGLVASLARPGGNVTGLSVQARDLAGKRLELLREVVPRLRRLGVMADANYSAAISELREVQQQSNKLSLEIVTLEIRAAEDIEPAFVTLQGGVDALYVVADPLVSTNRLRINTLALADKLPTMHGFRELVEGGGLMSYGPDFPDLYARAADFVDKILHGTKPAYIPVEQPMKFELIISAKTAKTLALAIPPTLLALADAVIE